MFSADQSRRPSKAVRRRRRRDCCIAAYRSRGLGRGEAERCSPEHRGCAEAAVCHHVLQGFVRVVSRDRTVFMVVMAFTLPMQHRVRGFVGVAEGGGLTSDGDHLPKGRENEKNEDEAATHRMSLSRGLRMQRGCPAS